MVPVELIEHLASALRETFLNGVGLSILENLFWTLIIFLLLGVLYQVLRLSWLQRIEDVTIRHRIRKRLRIALGTTGLLLALPIWAPFSGWLFTLLTIVAAALTIVLKEVILNFAGGIYIAVSKPFRLGDRVEIAGIRGDVVDIRPTRFTVFEVGAWVEGEQSTGRLVHIPNGQLFTHPLHNATEGLEYLWNELTITCHFESDWRAARTLLEELGRQVSASAVRKAREDLQRLNERYPIQLHKLDPYVYTEITPQGVKLTLRYLSPVRGRRQTADEIHRQLLDRLAREPGIRLVGMPDTHALRGA
jgi:small-conductance mechanosensitive channel|nr:MAG: mechanosensitive ion channel protein [Bacteroidota bacterium]